MPKVCPSCGTKLSKVEIRKELSAALYCKNKNCEAQHIENLIHFVSKKGMNIDGLGEKIIETFHDIGLITDIASLYRLRKEDIEGLDGFGEKSADNIIASINTSRNVPFHRFLYSLGIRHVGETTAKDIAKHFTTIEALHAASYEELSQVDGVGEKVAESIISFFNDKSSKLLLRGLLKEVTILKEISKKGKGLLTGFTFVITGTLPTLSRDEAKDLIESHGGKVSSSVSAKTSYLLTGENAGSKLTDATKLNVRIISEEDIKNML